MLDDDAQGLVEPGMRIAFGQQPEMRRQCLKAVYRNGAVQKPAGIECYRFGLKRAEMLVKPCAPQEIDAIARLQHRLHAP